MAKAEIFAGICGFNTTVKTRMEGDACQIQIESDCDAIRKMAANLTQVDPYKELSFRRSQPQIYQAAFAYCKHTACPVPAGIVKAVEVAAGLALPADATIKVSKDD